MNTPAFHAFMSGAIALGFLAIGLFFLSFWRRTRDRLFALFATAFFLLAVERVILVLVSPEYEFRPYIYVVRLLAFLVIIAAIVDRNRRPAQ
jgi:uncharacterized membrane protein